MSPTLTTEPIPESLTSLDQWICWREDKRDGKPTKVPIKPYRTSGAPHASATDPTTWRGFETAVSYHRNGDSRTDGVGFVFDPDTEIVGVDLDNCRDPDTETIEEWATDIIDRLDSYTEVSPSGTGVHVLVQGELPPGRNRRDDVEIYDRDRFFTVTGERVAETPADVVPRQDALVAVHFEYVETTPDEETVSLEQATETAVSHTESADTGPLSKDSNRTTSKLVGRDSGSHRKFGEDAPTVDDPALEAALHGLSPGDVPNVIPRTIDDIAGPGIDLSDADLLERAVDSKSGDTIQKLLNGDTELWAPPKSRYASQSEADMGLCFFLGFWTGGDPERMDRLFRESGMYREKWDRQHYGNGATYGAVCVARTLLKLDDYYTPSARSDTGDDQQSASTTSSPASPSGSRRVDPSQREATTERAHEDGQPHEIPPYAMELAEDNQRLAATVTRQQRQLSEYEDEIANLEAQVQWYRLIIRNQGEDALLPPFDEMMVTSSEDNHGVRDIDPVGEPASPPEGDLKVSEDEKEATAAPDGGPDHERDEDGGGSRLGRWIRRRMSGR